MRDKVSSGARRTHEHVTKIAGAFETDGRGGNVTGHRAGRHGRGCAGMVAETQHSASGIVSDMSRYCTACWRNARLHPDCWSDCTQEVFNRMLQRVSLDAWEQALRSEGDERREFLRAIDAVKKRTQRSLRRSTNLNDVVADHRDGADRALAEQREAIRLAADELLTGRQQRIMQMSFDGWSVQDMASALQLSAQRVSDEKYKAIRKLRARFAEEECAV